MSCSKTDAGVPRSRSPSPSERTPSTSRADGYQPPTQDSSSASTNITFAPAPRSPQTSYQSPIARAVDGPAESKQTSRTVPPSCVGHPSPQDPGAYAGTHLAGYLPHFRYVTDAFARSLATVKQKYPSLHARRLQILGLGCGVPSEGPAYETLFGRRFHYHGVDIDARKILVAQHIYKTASFTFEISDATEGTYKTPADGYDLIVCRHQNFDEQPLVWMKMIDVALDKLKQNGILYITSYYQAEHGRMKAYVDGLGLDIEELTPQMAVPANKFFPRHPEAHWDGHILVIRKKAGDNLTLASHAKVEWARTHL